MRLTDLLALIVLLQTLTLAVSGPASSPEYLPIWVAAADGHFARQGLKVTLRATRSEVGAAEALAQGQADLAATSLEALLRFGAREGQHPRLLLGLTAAPPVALVVGPAHAGRVRSVGELSGLRVGISAPGAAEHSWLHFLLARAGLSPVQVHVVSVGTQALERALTSGEVHAALVPEPAASRLLGDNRAALLADLRTPAAAQRALGISTVSAAIFVRADRRPGERELAAFTRAILAAEGRLAAGRAEDLAVRLPRQVVELPASFTARVEQAKTLYLAEGRVSADQLAGSAAFLGEQLPLPARAKVLLLPSGRFKPTPTR
ncbi:MAG: ABC transporter substrate-binding protein [Candidatus Rokubacteria bacterium]|nr:ABC transporter substrate-binding protein [Candidatus Rokubacteria bacterium]